jgi:hypothetical protein
VRRSTYRRAVLTLAGGVLALATGCSAGGSGGTGGGTLGWPSKNPATWLAAAHVVVATELADRAGSLTVLSGADPSTLSASRLVTGAPGHYLAPTSASADGTHVLVNASTPVRDSTGQVWEVSLQDGSARRLGAGLGELADGVYLPGGAVLAVQRGDSGDALVELTGTTHRTVLHVPPGSTLATPVVLADGIYVVVAQDGASVLRLIDLRSGTAAPVPSAPKGPVRLAVAGAQLLVTYDGDAGPQTVLWSPGAAATTDLGVAGPVGASPDGRTALATTPGTESGIDVVHLAARQPIRRELPSLVLANPVWVR